ncbi:hypothetical protein FB451DRAFT_65385 [Mycena latifolia]|nr:hypothetical protein FB451DRAFT_65385 [Mycena latifolia]
MNAGIAEHPWLPPFDPDTAGSRRLVKPDPSTADINLTVSCTPPRRRSRHFSGRMPPGFRGKLILTASMFGYFPSRAMPLYAAAKAGIINLMRSAAQYYAAKNITVNAVDIYQLPLMSYPSQWNRDTPVSIEGYFVIFIEQSFCE